MNELPLSQDSFIETNGMYCIRTQIDSEYYFLVNESLPNSMIYKILLLKRCGTC